MTEAEICKASSQVLNCGCCGELFLSCDKPADHAKWMLGDGSYDAWHECVRESHDRFDGDGVSSQRLAFLRRQDDADEATYVRYVVRWMPESET